MVCNIFSLLSPTFLDTIFFYVFRILVRFYLEISKNPSLCYFFILERRELAASKKQQGKEIMKSILFLLVGLACLLSVQGASLVATYAFNDSLAAQENGVASLGALNPYGTNAFETATVFGQTRRVYHWDGDGTNQAGLSLNTSGLVASNDYSIEMVFQFLDRNSAWRRIFDAQNRSSDSGFYVSPSNTLGLYPQGNGSATWTNGVFYHVVLTNANTSTVRGYLNGGLQFSFSASSMNISSNLIQFFVDDASEVSDGQIALIRVYNGVLSDSEVTTLSQNPFTNINVSVPEPASLLYFCLVGLVLLAYRR